MDKCKSGEKINTCSEVCESCGDHQKSNGLICTECSSESLVNSAKDKCLDKCSSGYKINIVSEACEICGNNEKSDGLICKKCT